jgi:hypothetical protein
MAHGVLASPVLEIQAGKDDLQKQYRWFLSLKSLLPALRLQLSGRVLSQHT